MILGILGILCPITRIINFLGFLGFLGLIENFRIFKGSGTFIEVSRIFTKFGIFGDFRDF